eukprot:TRINITY_DN10750_c0_g1::TRINITY_DN10750_c0_g1_i1::g.10331::m.10331 TRINITY_DN10750_c0_g1::TRINITY_DN10750_c0_g1_i1::g.10331  ORF type:complete len:171 (+),score=18.04 TRINITY_DN10750_c0_g1_i1:38-550(+)
MSVPAPFVTGHDAMFVFRYIDTLKPLSSKGPLAVYELIARSTLDLTWEHNQALHKYADAISLFKQGVWKDSLEFFQDASRLIPGDIPTQRYMDRCMALSLRTPLLAAPSTWMISDLAELLYRARKVEGSDLVLTSHSLASMSRRTSLSTPPVFEMSNLSPTLIIPETLPE